MSMRRRGIERFARRNAERRLGVFGSMVCLLSLAVQRVTAQERIVFFLFEPAGGVQALFVARRDVTRYGFRLGAFECDDVSWHIYSLLSVTVSSSSLSAPSSPSVRPKSDVTGTRERVCLRCFSSCDWQSTVKRVKGIASSRACGMFLLHISQTPYEPSSMRFSASSIS